MSLPEVEDPAIHGIPKERLPFTEIKVNNKDPKRLKSSIPSDEVYRFDWSQESRG